MKANLKTVVFFLWASMFANSLAQNKTTDTSINRAKIKNISTSLAKELVSREGKKNISTINDVLDYNNDGIKEPVKIIRFFGLYPDYNCSIGAETCLAFPKPGDTTFVYTSVLSSPFTSSDQTYYCDKGLDGTVDSALHPDSRLRDNRSSNSYCYNPLVENMLVQAMLYPTMKKMDKISELHGKLKPWSNGRLSGTQPDPKWQHYGTLWWKGHSPSGHKAMFRYEYPRFLHMAIGDKQDRMTAMMDTIEEHIRFFLDERYLDLGPKALDLLTQKENTKLNKPKSSTAQRDTTFPPYMQVKKRHSTNRKIQP